MTFLQFTEIPWNGKTQVWRVENSNDGSRLGIIKWHGAWRKYVLLTGPGATDWLAKHDAFGSRVHETIIWSPDCLLDVAQFITTQMNLRRKTRT